MRPRQARIETIKVAKMERFHGKTLLGRETASGMEKLAYCIIAGAYILVMWYGAYRLVRWLVRSAVGFPG